MRNKSEVLLRAVISLFFRSLNLIKEFLILPTGYLFYITLTLRYFNRYYFQPTNKWIIYKSKGVCFTHMTVTKLSQRTDELRANDKITGGT